MNAGSHGGPAGLLSSAELPGKICQVLNHTVYQTICWTLLGCSAVLLSGCNPPPRPSFAELSRTDPDEDLADEVEESLDHAPPLKPFSQPWQTWQSWHIAGRHVGYSHVRAEPQTSDPGSPIQITLEEQVTIRRGPSTMVQQVNQTALETRTGELISFEAERRTGPVLIKYSGSVEGDILTVVTQRGSKSSTHTVDWEPGCRGLAGLQQSLLSDPMRPGQKRRLQSLIPLQYSVGTIELSCQHVASIAMPDATVQEGFEIEVATYLGDGPPLETMIWTDADGRMLKSYTPALDLVAFDTTRGDATENIVASEDILKATAVEVTGKELADPSQAMRVGYAVVPRKGHEDAPETSLFQGQPGQWSRKTPEGTYQLLVSRDPNEPVRDGFVTIQTQPDREDSRSGPLIDSSHPLVKKLADTSQAKKDQPLRIALDLTQTAKTMVRRSDYAQGFRPASIVARDGSGDCTAHSVLLAAMLIHGSPSRVQPVWAARSRPKSPSAVAKMIDTRHAGGDTTKLPPCAL